MPLRNCSTSLITVPEFATLSSSLLWVWVVTAVTAIPDPPSSGTPEYVAVTCRCWRSCQPYKGQLLILNRWQDSWCRPKSLWELDPESCHHS